MGSYFVNAVIRGLAGLEFKCQVGTRNNGEPVSRSFGATDLAFMVVIANEQPNPGFMQPKPPHKEIEDTFCFRDIKNLISLSHASKTVAIQSRTLLLKLGVLKWSPSESNLPNVSPTRSGSTTTYDNVYRINMPKIREIANVDDADWMDILRLTKKDREKMSAERRRILGFSVNSNPVRNPNNPVWNPNDAVRNPNDAVRNPNDAVRNPNGGCSESEHKHIIEQNKTTITTTKPATAVGKIIEKVAVICNVSANRIVPDTFEKAVEEHDEIAVKSALAYAKDAYVAKKESQKNGEVVSVGYYIRCFEKALKRNYRMSEAELNDAYGFKPPKRELTKTEYCDKKWEEAKKKFGFDQLSQAELDDLKKKTCEKLMSAAGSPTFDEFWKTVIDDVYNFRNEMNVSEGDVKGWVKAFLDSLNDHIRE